MSTSTALNTYRVTWLANSGDRADVRTHTVQSTGAEINTNVGFIFFRDADGVTVYSISTVFVVSIELVTEKG